VTDTDAAGEARTARETRTALEALLATEPGLAQGLPPSFAAAAERFVALLLRANRRVNLTRVLAPEEVARLHLLDALAALPLLDDAAPGSVIDLGSGGGVPALPLALARPEPEWILVDSVAKKVRELDTMVAALRLPQVRAVAERAEVLGRDPAHREQHDLVTARACAPLPVLLELALPMLRVGGELIAWKGPLGDGDTEVLGGRAASALLGGGALTIHPPAVASLGGHCLVTVRKIAPTPDRYPRRAGVPGRRPLA
jgi:16S rRNA (guanine527-N7)-methyltransferase